MMILIGMIVVVTILVLLIVIFLLPAEKGSKPKRPKKEEPTEKEKELEAKILRLEKHIQTLKTEIEALQNQQRAKEKELAAEQGKNRHLQEKLAQEKSWREKEQETIDKRSREMIQFKQEHLKLEKDFEGEHSLRLRLEHESKDLKRDLDQVNAERRALSTKVLGLESSLGEHKKELEELKKLNAKLKEKNEAVMWVAKSEYDKLGSLLKEKEKELERLQRAGS